MKSNSDIVHGIGDVAGHIGKGLLAGLAGTAVMNAAQMIEMELEDREPSDTPVKVVKQVLNVEPKDEAYKQQVSNLIHFGYGTSWGTLRGLLGALCIRGWKATMLHFGAVWGTALIMLPSLDAAPPVKEWGKKSLIKDALLHAVYAIAAGVAYDLIDDKKK